MATASSQAGPTGRLDTGDPVGHQVLRGYWLPSPFSAHAWVEVDGVSVGEGLPPGYFQTFFAVPEQSC